MNGDTLFLKVGDSSSDGKIHIIDEDRLCFQVRSTNGSIRTISKNLLREFIEYFNQHPDASSADARNDLSGKTDIDKFEYGYPSIWMPKASMMVGYRSSVQNSLVLSNVYSGPLRTIA